MGDNKLMPKIPKSHREEMIFLSDWIVDSEHNKEVLDTVEQLKELFPSDDKYGEVFLKEQVGKGKEPIKIDTKVGQLYLYASYDVYSRPIKGKGFEMIRNIAYGCNACGKIIVGAPMTLTEESMNSRILLSGRSSLSIYCRNCEAHFATETLMAT